LSADPSNIESIKDVIKKCIDIPFEDRANFTINNDNLLKKDFNKSKLINKITNILVGNYEK
jgi:hypothetical protein